MINKKNFLLVILLGSFLVLPMGNSFKPKPQTLNHNVSVNNLGKTKQDSSWVKNSNWGNKPISNMLQDTKGNIWVAQASIGLWKSTDNGRTFNITKYDSSYTFNNISQDIKGNLWVGDYKGYMWKSTDDGTTFIKLTPHFTTPNGGFDIVDKVFTDKANNVWVKTRDNLIWKSTDNASSFARDMDLYFGETKSITFIKLDNQGNIWVGNRSDLYKSTDNGLSFKMIANNQVEHLGVLDLYQDTQGTYWVSGFGNFILKSLDGENFNKISIGSGIVSVHYFYQDKMGFLWLMGSSYLWKSTDKGQTFTKEYKTNNNFIGMIQDRVGNYYLYGLNSGIVWKQDKLYGYTIENGGKEIDSPYGGEPYKFINENTLFYSNDELVNSITINGRIYNKNKYFSIVLNDKDNGGKYVIKITKINGDTAMFYFWIKKSIIISEGDFTTDSGYKLTQYQADYNWNKNQIGFMFVQGDNGTPDLKMNFSDPIINLINCYYQNILGYNKDGSIKVETKKSSLLSLEISGYGIYLITIKDKLGNEIQYYLQIGKTTDKPLLNKTSDTKKSSTLTKGKPTPNEGVKNNLGWIIGGLVGGLVVFGIIGWGIYLRRTALKYRPQKANKGSKSSRLD